MSACNAGRVRYCFTDSVCSSVQFQYCLNEWIYRHTFLMIQFFEPHHSYKIPRGTSLSRSVKYKYEYFANIALYLGNGIK